MVEPASIGIRGKRVVAALLALLALSCLSASTIAAPTVFCSPEPLCQLSDNGDEFTVSIWVDDSGDSIGCFHLLFTYDRQRATLLDADLGSLFVGPDIDATFFWEYPAADTTAFTGCLLGHRTYVLGPGEIATLRFRLDQEQCPPDTLGLFFVEHRFEPPPEDWPFLADIDRVLIPEVAYVDDTVWLCDSCLSSVPEGEGLRGGWLETYPNPATAQIGLSWRLPESASQAVLELFAADGRRVLAQNLDEPQGTVRWNLRDSGGIDLPAGTYFARLRSGGTTISRKFVRIR